MPSKKSAAEIVISKSEKWEAEQMKLRSLILECGLDETIKWSCPCYTIDNRNIVLLHEFKQYCAILFFKGALLKDTKGLLVQQTENVQSARQLRFTSLAEIEKRAAVIKSYVKEAIKVEMSGAKVELKKTDEFDIPDEFQEKLHEIPALRKAFEKLTPGRQRGYILHFSSAKQSQTRASRVEKYIPHIMAGKGIND